MAHNNGLPNGRIVSDLPIGAHHIISNLYNSNQTFKNNYEIPPSVRQIEDPIKTISPKKIFYNQFKIEELFKLGQIKEDLKPFLPNFSEVLTLPDNYLNLGVVGFLEKIIKNGGPRYLDEILENIHNSLRFPTFSENAHYLCRKQGKHIDEILQQVQQTIKFQLQHKSQINSLIQSFNSDIALIEYFQIFFRILSLEKLYNHSTFFQLTAMEKFYLKKIILDETDCKIMTIDKGIHDFKLLMVAEVLEAPIEINFLDFNNQMQSAMIPDFKKFDKFEKIYIFMNEDYCYLNIKSQSQTASSLNQEKNKISCDDCGKRNDEENIFFFHECGHKFCKFCLSSGLDIIRSKPGFSSNKTNTLRCHIRFCIGCELLLTIESFISGRSLNPYKQETTQNLMNDRQNKINQSRDENHELKLSPREATKQLLEEGDYRLIRNLQQSALLSNEMFKMCQFCQATFLNSTLTACKKCKTLCCRGCLFENKKCMSCEK